MDKIVSACNPDTQEVETKGSEVQGLLWVLEVTAGTTWEPVSIGNNSKKS